ncbi:c-type cytochrome biogenesis protein CcmI [Shewanella surugensis]|uniref:C-type cytochrome biogenesis protein CcmI n=1 Tax=Shewanella surugensis TaxID=212020 RepID=A0ABT0LF34_9GAMM|nr:c-type cytochrome biogenesis protein CcmI [Shewanella surugensis]MCL1125937.1 c-type cytochrome biogenesis protein CcmI [Shewanella surugensis]
MTTLWIFLALFILVSILLIWLPHFRQTALLKTATKTVRKQTNLTLFNQRLHVLEQELKDNLLDQNEFNSLKQEFEISLLQDIKQGEDEALMPHIKPKGLFWPSLMTLVVLAISGYLYSSIGAYQALAWANSPKSQQKGPLSMQQRIEMMQAQAQIQPDNSQLWFSLGHAYMATNEYKAAINAFDTAIDLAGIHAELLGPKATAMYYDAQQTLTPEIQSLIKQSLTLNPTDPSTLLLVGMDAFLNGQYQAAIDAWQLILDTNQDNIDRVAISNAINNAKAQLKEPDPQAAIETELNNTLTLNISVASALQSHINTGDTLFVFARTTTVPQVPLVAIKVSADALPTQVVLTNSDSLSEQKLIKGEAVEVIAVLSKNNNLKPQAGDLKGHIASLVVGENAQLELNTLVK